MNYNANHHDYDATGFTRSYENPSNFSTITGRNEPLIATLYHVLDDNRMTPATPENHTGAKVLRLQVPRRLVIKGVNVGKVSVPNCGCQREDLEMKAIWKNEWEYSGYFEVEFRVPLEKDRDYQFIFTIGGKQYVLNYE